jgi:hypothetical protein
MCAWASYAVYVGRNLTADGSVMLGGTGDEPSSHWLEIVPRKNHAAGETIRVGVEKDAHYPGELIDIPQVPVTAKYITMNYSEFAGLPAPLTNGGLNEYGVAARDVWSPSRKELTQMTPNPQHGLNYSDLSRIVMERARSAREAVEIVGQVTEALRAFEDQSMVQSAAVEARATKLFGVGETAMATDTLTEYSSGRAMDALRLGDALLGSIESRHRLLYGYRAPVGTAMSGYGHPWGVAVDCRLTQR